MWMVSAANAASKRFAKQILEMDGLRLASCVPCGVPGRRRRMGCAGNIDGVMDGDLDGFLNAYLTQLATGELKK